MLWLSDIWTERNRDRAIQYAREAYELAPNAVAIKNRLIALGVNPDQDEAPEDVMFVEDSKVAALPPSAAAGSRPVVRTVRTLIASALEIVAIALKPVSA